MSIKAFIIICATTAGFVILLIFIYINCIHIYMMLF